jgi:hypothetical protein
MRLADDADIRHVTENLRQWDREEIAAATGKAPEAVVPYSIAVSYATYAVFDPSGTPMAIFGVTDGTIPGEKERWGIPWLLGTNAIFAYPVSFIRAAPTIVSMVEEDFDVLWNFTLKGNNPYYRWLRHAGMTIGAPVQYGPFNVLFNPFWKITERYKCATQSASESELPRQGSVPTAKQGDPQQMKRLPRPRS